jgi:hypothetical protein
MGLQAVSAAAAGVGAASVAQQEGLVLAFGDDAVGASEVEQAAAAGGVGAGDRGADPAAAEQPFDDRAGQAGPVRDPADRGAAFTWMTSPFSDGDLGRK